MNDDLFRDEDFETPGISEDEDDISVTAEQFANLIVAPSDWTVGTIFSQIGKQIDLDPSFQRRDVWSLASKSKFIESLILGIPIPQILLSVSADKKGSYIVLDGKQRLLTISEFLQGQTLDGKTFKLKGLRVLKELENKSWPEIKELSDWEDQLLNETVRTTIVKNWQTQEVLYEIFYRLNSGSVQLSPMELRMALYPGEFLKWVVNWTENIGPLHQLLRKKRPDKRMADVEIAVRFLSFSTSPQAYEGDLKDYLDGFCKYANNNFMAVKKALVIKLLKMNDAISLGIKIFPENRFCRKYSADGYENRFNRALFDVLVGSLSNADFYAYATANKKRVREAFEELCLEDSDFIRSVETSTKNVDETEKRFSAWYKKVEKKSGVQIPLPSIRQ